MIMNTKDSNKLKLKKIKIKQLKFDRTGIPLFSFSFHFDEMINKESVTL